MNYFKSNSIALSCLLSIISLGASVTAGSAQESPVYQTSDTAADLARSVRKLNHWLAGDSQASGWRRFLQLNILDAQAARGNQADLVMLRHVSDRFHSGAHGLDHPRFAEVATALDRHLELLGRSQASIEQLMVDARSRYHRITVSEIDSQRNRAIADLELLKRHYRRTIPSRERANLFYDLKLDELIEELRVVEFELAPEVSVGKIDSMLRDLRAKAKDVERKIDALPFEEDGQPANGAVEGQLQVPNQPTEDKQEDSRQELQKQMTQLNDEIKAMQQSRREVLASDRPRLTRRANALRSLFAYENRLVEVSKKQGDPYFVAAAASFEKFFRTMAYGTSDNLQEEYLERLGSVEEFLSQLAGPNARSAAGNLGDALRWLENTNQAPELVTAIRSRYSKPNAYVSIASSLINELASQSIDRTEPVRRNVGGRLARGTSHTKATVSIDLVEDPNQVHASIHLFGNVSIGTYVQQGKLQIFTQACGDIEARRSVFANVGGLYANESKLAANFRADFLGTTSRLKLVNRIANKKFEEQRGLAEGDASRAAESQLREEFADQTDEPIEAGKKQLGDLIKRGLAKSSMLPDTYLYSKYDRVMVVAKKETMSTLASATEPTNYNVNPQIAVRVHDTMLSNLLDKAFAGKTFSNAELAEEIGEMFGQTPEGFGPGDADKANEAEEEPFSITFSSVRPIQFEFEDQGFSVVVAGRRFSQGDKKINEPLNIIFRFRIVNQNGQLKLVRNGDVDFSYEDPTKTTPKIVGFRSFLDGRLNRGPDAAEQKPIDLPANLLPLDKIEALKDSPIAARLRLVQFRSENGWLYIGWNLMPEYGMSPAWVYDLPGIWNEATVRQLDSTYTPDE